MLDRMLHERARNEGAKKAAAERKRKGETIKQTLKEAKRLSTGTCAQVGIYSLNNPEFLQAYDERQAEAREKEQRAASNKRKMLHKKIDGIKKLRVKYGHESTHRFVPFSREECGLYLQYKKQSRKDPAMPKDLNERRARCLEWMGRASPVASPHASDDEEDVDGLKTEGRAAAVAALLGLANNSPAHGDGDSMNWDADADAVGDADNEYGWETAV